MAIHDRAYTRTKSWTKALRKYHIDRDVSAGKWYPLYNNLHQYSKNIIHCPCPMCSAKTNNKNRKGYWDPNKNWSISDQKKINSMESQVEDLNVNLE